jgi:hypothetical protein
MLHAQGIIIQKFSREIPIIIHELEYYDKVIEWNKRANPLNLVADFEKWIVDM